MSLTVEDVQRWDPGAVRAVGEAARNRAEISTDTANRLPRFPDWTGPGSEEAKAALEQSRQALLRDAAAASAAARAADAAAVNVQIVKDNLKRVLDMARECGMLVDPVSGSVMPGRIPALPNDWNNAKVLQEALNQVLRQADSVDDQLAAAMDSADDVVDVPPEARPIPLPPPGASAEEVDQWWRSLSQKDRERLIEEHPPEVGNLNGIPAAARDAINQQVLNDDLNRITDVATQHGVSTDQVLANPGFYGLSAADVARYQNAVKVREGLNHQRGSDPNPARQRPVMLWKYEPLADGGQGRAAIAIGNPDYADNTSVIVPGTGSSVKGGWLSDGHNDAMNLWDEANAADPNSTHAVISWMGYDAPDGFTDTRVANPDLARQGGDLLAADVNGLWVTHHDPQQHVTVIGHSYGSTTVADAFAGSGMHANDAVLLGCPGTDLARSAADFHLDGGKVYVGSASTDPVSYIGTAPEYAHDYLNQKLGYPVGLNAGLGLDPAGDQFGSVRFDAEVVGRDGLDTNDHSHYYDKGGEALRAMTYIATGESGQLAEEGLLAEGRRQPHVDLPREIDLPFGPTIPLPPVGFDIPGSPAYIDPEADRPAESVTKDHAF
ncbi:alpha/beta hydrolase [Mycolicibacterium sp. 120270]|uniref:alpha/beta hydrolase n=1 Tax=Mycolicibacterium sp. 120270 TaxID=3090600 RepID=UPI00299E5BBA|nr:alpha/beta hydrolase [Mycolicibacterium sp. 120270]MDX1883349.1 alpha/beta hydrolase [Mycolicibacterium sp. 120270]